MKSSKSTNGRFKKSSSSNCSGRPIGSPNESTLLAEQLLEGAEDLTRAIRELARNGNLHTLRIVSARLVRNAAQELAILERKP